MFNKSCLSLVCLHEVCTWLSCVHTHSTCLLTVHMYSQLELLSGWYSLRQFHCIVIFTFNAILYLDLLLPSANFLLLLFANILPRSTSNSEMPTAEGKYVFSFCFFFIISSGLDLNTILLFLRGWGYGAYQFFFCRLSFCEYNKT